MLLSERYPALYAFSVGWHRGVRRPHWIYGATPHTVVDDGAVTAFRVTAHSSILLRKLRGVDMQLQRNKVENLRLAIRRLDGRVVRPGETLSFWRCVGNPRARDGYRPGVILAGGRFDSAIGGGLCQLSNLLYWMALHSPLAVLEHHHHHSLDVFPDSGRVLPFGSGATVFYNYVDLVLGNPTPLTFRLRLRLTDATLSGALHAVPAELLSRGRLTSTAS